MDSFSSDRDKVIVVEQDEHKVLASPSLTLFSSRLGFRLAQDRFCKRFGWSASRLQEIQTRSQFRIGGPAREYLSKR